MTISRSGPVIPTIPHRRHPERCHRSARAQRPVDRAAGARSSRTGAANCPAAGFAAVVTKDHDYAGVDTAALITKHYPELSTKIFSSIVLNNVVGGINPYAVEHTAAMGGKIVWMPTLAAENHLRWEKTANWSHPASTPENASGLAGARARRQQEGARRRQGSARRRRQERHGAGERPPPRQRDLARVRGGASGAASSV